MVFRTINKITDHPVVTKWSMCFSTTMFIAGIILLISKWDYKDVIPISEHSTYTEGTKCVVQMPFFRDVWEISQDMAKCVHLHSEAIGKRVNL